MTATCNAPCITNITWYWYKVHDKNPVMANAQCILASVYGKGVTGVVSFSLGNYLHKRKDVQNSRDERRECPHNHCFFLGSFFTTNQRRWLNLTEERCGLFGTTTPSTRQTRRLKGPKVATSIVLFPKKGSLSLFVLSVLSNRLQPAERRRIERLMRTLSL